jgi:hypothetical protein
MSDSDGNDLGRRLEIGAILSTSMADIATNVVGFGGLALLLAVAGGSADTYLPDVGNIVGNLALFFISVLAVYLTLRAKLGDDDIRPRFGAAFGFNLLSNLAIVVGLILLIVPGLLIFVRWAVGLPALLRENLSVSEAMARSSILTEGNRWRILGLSLVIWGPFLLAMVLMGGLFTVFAGEASLDMLPFNMLVNLAAGCASILSSVCWTEAYLALSGEEEGHQALAEIFA